MEAVESPSVEVFIRCTEDVHRDMLHWWPQLTLELYVLKGLFQQKKTYLYDSMFL